VEEEDHESSNFLHGFQTTTKDLTFSEKNNDENEKSEKNEKNETEAS